MKTKNKLSNFLTKIKVHRDKDRVRNFEQLLRLSNDHRSVLVRYSSHVKWIIQPASRVVHVPAIMFHRMLKEGIFIYHKESSGK